MAAGDSDLMATADLDLVDSDLMAAVDSDLAVRAGSDLLVAVDSDLVIEGNTRRSLLVSLMISINQHDDDRGEDGGDCVGGLGASDGGLRNGDNSVDGIGSEDVRMR